MKRLKIQDIISILFIILFTYTGIEKLTDITLFKEQVGLSPILAQFSKYIAVLLPIIELSVVMLLIFPRWRLKGLYSSLILMVAFLIYIIALQNINEDVLCACSGLLEQLTWKQHFIFNLGLIALAITGIIFELQAKKQLNFYLRSLSAFTIALCLFTGCASPPTVKTGLEGKTIPSFNVQLLDSITRINTSAINEGQPTVFVLFIPSCAYCRAQTQDIVNNIQSLSKINFYILSNYPISQIRNYSDHYQLSKYSNITVGRDSTSYLLNYFSARGVPLVAVYNKEKKLKQVFPGRVEPTEIKTIAFE